MAEAPISRLKRVGTRSMPPYIERRRETNFGETRGLPKLVPRGKCAAAEFSASMHGVFVPPSNFFEAAPGPCCGNYPPTSMPQPKTKEFAGCSRDEQTSALQKIGADPAVLAELDEDSLGKVLAEQRRRGDKAAVRKATALAEELRRRSLANSATKAKAAPATTQRGIDKAFRAFDLDRSGTIERSEFISIMTHGTTGLTTVQAEMLFDELDEDRSGTVDVEEFRVAWGDIEGQYAPGVFRGKGGDDIRRIGRIALVVQRFKASASRNVAKARGSMKRLTAGSMKRLTGSMKRLVSGVNPNGGRAAVAARRNAHRNSAKTREDFSFKRS